MTQYMHYRGRAVEIYGPMAAGQQVPLLHDGDQGEKIGDVAVIDEQTVVWDGRNWTPAPNIGHEAIPQAS